uniref:uncharacterized protein n=1 Tax=Myxine glutinosa TaxID=7769 RepID=UPI00358FB695
MDTGGTKGKTLSRQAEKSGGNRDFYFGYSLEMVIFILGMSSLVVGTLCCMHYFGVMREQNATLVADIQIYDYAIRHKQSRSLMDDRDTPLEPDGLHGINTFLHLAHTRADIANESNCWICTQMPHSSENGVPLEAVPFGWDELCSRFPKRLVATIPYLPMAMMLGNVGWEKGGYQCEEFADSYGPKYGNEVMPPSVTIQQQMKGLLCFVRHHTKENNTFMGNSTCHHYSYELGYMILPVSIRNDSLKMISLFWEGTWMTDTTWTYNNTYFICGHKAYAYLPLTWSGSCFLGFVLPRMRLLTESPMRILHARQKRTVSMGWNGSISILWNLEGRP